MPVSGDISSLENGTVGNNPVSHGTGVVIDGILIINARSTSVLRRFRYFERHFQIRATVLRPIWVVTHRSLRKSALGYDPVKAYAACRASAAGTIRHPVMNILV